jgi:uncharacterized protein
MPQRTDTFDLEALRLRSGEGRRLELGVPLDRLSYGGNPYDVTPSPVTATLDVSRMTHAGYALRLRFSATLHGPCMRCLEGAEPTLDVDVREVSQPGGGDEMQSPYVADGELDITSWARDALSLTVPDQILCRPDCAGLCPICGENLNDAGPEHQHEAEPDPRWAKLRELKFD